MLLADLLGLLADAFPVHKFDAESARESALRRLAALQSLPFPVPEEVLASYRDANPVDVILADDPDTALAVLESTIWPERDGCVTTVEVCFTSKKHQKAASVLLARVAEVLGWEAEDVSDEVD